MSFGDFSLSICLDSYSIVYSVAKYIKPQPTKKCHICFIIFFYRVNISGDNFHSALGEVPASDVSSQHMSRVMRKPVFGVSDLVPHKPGCTATEDG